MIFNVTEKEIIDDYFALSKMVNGTPEVIQSSKSFFDPKKCEVGYNCETQVKWINITVTRIDLDLTWADQNYCGSPRAG